jgi:hypothetical protein
MGTHWEQTANNLHNTFGKWGQYTWKLNHGQTIWDKKLSGIENILRNTLET